MSAWPPSHTLTDSEARRGEGDPDAMTKRGARGGEKRREEEGVKEEEEDEDEEDEEDEEEEEEEVER